MRMITPKKDRNGTYVLRKKVPVHLQSLTTKKEIKRSLRTKDPHKARLAVPLVMLEIEQELKLIENLSLPESNLSTVEVEELCDQWLAFKSGEIEKDNALLVLWATESIGMGTVSDSKAFYFWQSELIDNAEYSYELRKKLTKPFISEICSLNGLIVHDDTGLFRRLSYGLIKRFLRLKEFALHRLRGDSDYDLGLKVVAVDRAKPSSSIIFSKLVEKWKASLKNEFKDDPNKAISRIMDYQISFERFILFSGDVDISKIKKKDIADFRDGLYQLPSRPTDAVRLLSFSDQISFAAANGLKLLSNNTVRKSILHLSAVLTYGVDSGYLNDNVSKGVKPKKTKKPHLVDVLNYYTEEDLDQIFSLPVFTEGARPRLGTLGESTYWVPIIMYYTGARLEEVCQLYRSNCKFDERSGVHYFRFDESIQGTSVKRGSSARDVPISNSLIELGFLEYINSIPSGGQIFPTLKPNLKGKVSAGFSKWWSEYLKANITGGIEGRQPSHAFRHTLETILRSCSVRQDISDAITGRTNKSSGAGYGGYLEAAKQAVALIPKLNLIKQI